MTYNIDPHEYDYLKNTLAYQPIIVKLKQDPCIFNSITTVNKPKASFLHITKKPTIDPYKKPVKLQNNVLVQQHTSVVKPKKQVTLAHICKEPVVKITRPVIYDNPLVNKLINKVIQMINDNQNKIILQFTHKNDTNTKDPALTPSIIKLIEDTVLKNVQGDVLNLIKQTTKDNNISGEETALYKDTDGTLKTIDVNEISKLIFNKVSEQLISEHDKIQDTNISNINSSVNDIQKGLNDIDVWKKFDEK